MDLSTWPQYSQGVPERGLIIIYTAHYTYKRIKSVGQFYRTFKLGRVKLIRSAHINILHNCNFRNITNMMAHGQFDPTLPECLWYPAINGQVNKMPIFKSSDLIVCSCHHNYACSDQNSLQMVGNLLSLTL